MSEVFFVTIDNEKIQANKGETILDVAKRKGIYIPHFCFDKRVLKENQCGICKCQIEGLDELVKTCEMAASEGQVIFTKSEKVKANQKEILDNLFSKHRGNCRPPCMTFCPGETDCQGYVALIRNGDYKEAIELIKEKIPLPAALGRVCPHPCEDNCRRQNVDEAVPIMWLKRFAADLDLFSDNPYSPKVEKETNKKVAIIGGGPMGLSCSYYLRQKGHQVTVFEGMPKAGGMLRYGIPEYRLPNSILDREIDLIKSIGVNIKENVKIGKDIKFEALRKEFDSIVIGIGAWKSMPIGCKGEEANGVIGGIEFLEQVVHGNIKKITGNVAIVGGGNTAMDAARTAVRLGAKNVYNIYRRTKDEMPAEKIEIDEALEEDVVFKTLRNPIEILKDKDGKVRGVVLQVMELGEADESGRRKPVPVEGATEEIKVDIVIPSIGQAVAGDFQLPAEPNIEKTKKGGIVCSLNSFMTSIEGVFAGGDCGNDKISIAIEAVGDGKKIAESVDHYLKGEKIEFKKPTLVEIEDNHIYSFEERDRMVRPKMYHLHPEYRKENFEEVVKGYEEKDALESSSMCLECGCHDYHGCELLECAHKNQYPNIKSAIPTEQVDMEEEFVIRDPNKCINCGKCIAVCQNLLGIAAHGKLENQGEVFRPENNKSLKEMGCVSCGQCVFVCPTGALEGKTKYKKNYWETEIVKTTCTYCGVGCQLNMHRKYDKVIGVSATDAIANEGLSCIKGSFAFDFINDKERLTTPLIRTNKKGVGVVPTWRKATWEEALNIVVSKIANTKETFGADSIMGFASAKVTNESNYLFQKMMRAAIGTNNVDHCARLCHSSSVAGLAKTLGSGAMTNPMTDVRKADLIFVTGSNTTEAHPVIGAYIRQAKLKGAKLIVADPKRIPLCSDADLFLQIKPGTSVALSNGMLNVIFSEGLEDKEYINTHTEGIEELKAVVKNYTLEKTAEICGVSKEDIYNGAVMYAKATSSFIAYSMGITQHLNGTDNVISMSNLALVTGNIGKEGAGVNPLRGQNNVQGSCDMGALPTDYPGYQKVIDEGTREKFQKAWNTELSNKPGITVTMTGHAILNDEIKLLYIMGENPMVSDPDTTHMAKALSQAFVICQDIFETETTNYADIVLPANSFAETEGTFTNTERRVQKVRPVVSAKGEAQHDWWILAEIMNRLGYKCNYDDAEAIFEEMSKVTSSYGGMDYKRIDKNGLCWPCLDKEHPGTPVLHTKGPVRGKGLLVGTEWLPSKETSLKEFPYVLITGRILEHYHTRTMTKRTKKIHNKFFENFIEIGPTDLVKLGLSQGDLAKVSSLRGSTVARVKESANVREGTLFMPFHFDKGANMLSDGNNLDPVSKIPGFKQIGVTIEKV